jgi:hypothetical protein
VVTMKRVRLWEVRVWVVKGVWTMVREGEGEVDELDELDGAADKDVARWDSRILPGSCLAKSRIAREERDGRMAF